MDRAALQGDTELMGIQAKLPTDAELRTMFDAVPKLERYRVGDAVVRAGTKPITVRAKQLIPRSKPSDTAKRSAKQKASADWDSPLWKAIKVVVRKGNRGGAIAVTGPDLHMRASSKIYLIAEHKKNTRRVFYWGKDAGKTKQKMRNIMVQAAEETRPAQLSAMKAALRQKMDEVWKRG